LGCGALPDRLDVGERSACGVRGSTVIDRSVVLRVRRALGLWRPDLRPHHAIPRHVTRHGGSAWILCRLRYADATDLQLRIRRQDPWNDFGNFDPHRRGHLPLWNRRCGHGRDFQGEGSIAETAHRRDQGVQSEERSAGGHILRHHERVFFLWPGRRRTGAGGRRAPWRSAFVAGAAGARHRTGRRLHYQRGVVRDSCMSATGPGLSICADQSGLHHGRSADGTYRFSSWTLHMASIMIFGAFWGLALKEWRGAGTAP